MIPLQQLLINTNKIIKRSLSSKTMNDQERIVLK